MESRIVRYFFAAVAFVAIVWALPARDVPAPPEYPVVRNGELVAP